MHAQQRDRSCLANWFQWLQSLRFIGRPRALRPSNSAIMAHAEVSTSTIGIHTSHVDSNVAFHSGQAALAAQNFNMPALSPTMTEGNIATWKIKEGTTSLAHHTRGDGHGGTE